ncbi:gamma-glutamyltransferase [Paenibacillus sp. IB182496]|uniref:Glutathione hydrolase proenzyme n=1 Tax=Paenibacillus sabuli TaxID=2772509 RepID=A0A927BZN5_9BACL|nr:gamma-glutamyltransferase [Paenibacillus sabuli]MBD2848530.1 gamma-glutamyltransferase [Paenibacillus sabuli]
MNSGLAMGYRSMIASPHRLASAAGSAVMARGGNAFDAAVAISATLGVVYPHMTGIGGDAFFLLRDGRTGEVRGLNGSGRSAAACTPALYTGCGLDAIPQRGVGSAITVPGMVDAWWEVSQRYGRLPWDELLEEAIGYAERGFPVSPGLRHWIVKDEPLLRNDAGLSRTYLPGGAVPDIGARLTHPELAATMRGIAAGGRDHFYNGALARELATAIARDGGVLTMDDLAAHRAEWVTPLRTTYRGYDVLQMPPNSQGFSLLLMLNMLERVELGAMHRESAEFFHLMAEVVKAAFRDRDRYLTDPDFADIPLERLLSKPYAAELYAAIEAAGAAASPLASPPIGQDTAYAAVVDEEGNCVSFIQSLYFDFGAGYTAGDTGVLLQNRGSFFALDPRQPNVLAPRKRSFHTLMPGMVLRGGRPHALLGTQGGEGQPQTSLSVLTGLLDFGCDAEQALALPRWIYGRTWGEASDALRIEDRGYGEQARQLRAMGHKVELLSPWDLGTGTAQAITIGADGLLGGAADPRGDGMAIGR